ncbi:hypothetical protein GW17_00008476 [Ensete ventricosum]|nr:hypothetical protein GW17_00008476 [Ensete ventricosum]
MEYGYTPTYYSSFQDTITSLCKSILPFSLKSRRPPLPDQKLAERHSDSLKWQQESFHRILHLMGLRNEGIVPESDVVAFRTHMLDTLIAAPKDNEPAGVIRDKLLFLQVFRTPKRCSFLISLRVELDCRDVIVRCPPMSMEEEWSDIELRDKAPSPVAGKAKHQTPIKDFISNAASWTGKGKKDGSCKAMKGPLGSVDVNVMDPRRPSMENQHSGKSSLLMPEGSPLIPIKSDKGKRKTFQDLFRKGGNKDESENREPLLAEPDERPVKSTWGLDGLRKWKRNDSE